MYGNERGGGGSQPPMMIVLHNKYGVIDPLWHIQYLGRPDICSSFKHTLSAFSQSRCVYPARPQVIFYGETRQIVHFGKSDC